MNQPSISITHSPIVVRPLLVVPDEPQPETCILCGGKSFVIRVLRGSMQERTTWACATCHPETVRSNGLEYNYGDVTAIRKAITDALQEPDTDTSLPAADKKPKISLYCPPPSVRATHKNIAIVTDAHLYIFERDENTTLVPSPSVAYPIDAEMDIPGLVTLLEQHACVSCWLISNTRFPGGQDVPLIRDFVKKADCLKLSNSEHSYTPLTGQKRILAGLTVKRMGRDGKPHGLPTMIYCAWANTWNTSDIFNVTAGLDRARVLAGSLFLTERLLNVALRYSASWTGHTILRETLQHWDKYIDFPQLSQETYDLIELHKTTWPLWTRIPTITDVYQYDRNWSFVSSAREVPVGNPHHIERYDLQQHGKLQGFYLLSAQAPAGWSKSWPGPFRDEQGNYPPSVVNVWAWTPLISLARKHGWTVNIHEGYAWEQSQKHDLFRLWQERLWNARRTADNYKEKASGLPQIVATVTIKILKLIGVAAIGKLLQRESSYLMDMDEAEAQGKEIVTLERTNKFELTGRAQVIEERSSDLYQPGWWNWIISMQSERILNALYTYAQDSCIGLYVDCLYCDKPIEALNGDRLKTGGFRLAGVSHAAQPGKALSPKELATLHKQGKDLPAWIAA